MTQPERPSQDPNPAGSPGDGEPVFLAVGRIRRPHGVQGEMVMDVLTDFPERLKRGQKVYIGEDRRPFHLRTLRPHGFALLVSFREFTTPEEAGVLRNQVMYVRSEKRPELEEGEFYHHQVLGLQVIDENGDPLGVVKEILETGANDVFVVTTGDGSELLLPATDEVLLEINLEAGQMRVRVLPGLRGEA